jgi:hypothetical protein
MNLIINNTEFNYRVYNSDYIKNNHQEIINDCYKAHDKFKKYFDCDSTWSYYKYNIFCLSSTSIHFYNIYKELLTVIKLYHNKPEPLWFQSWLNFHNSNEVLDWHTHYWPYHGYISIDPKNTITEFEKYSIKNEIGNIYIGPGLRLHKVNVLENFQDKRITLGFDVLKLGFDDVGQISNYQNTIMPIV